MPKLTASLSPKHFEALKLIEEGNFSYREIAKLVGFSEAYFYDLIEGNIKDTSGVAVLFSAEVNKIIQATSKKIKIYTKDIKGSLLTKLREWSKIVENKKSLKEDDIKSITSVLNALAKSTPNVEIGSFSYTKGLSPEDLFNEFRRLKDIATDRRGLSGTNTGRTGEIPRT